jgi:exodeoxyribonuclease III
MRIATWNINSVRLRLPLLQHLIKTKKPDVICLQETKTPDELFPREPLEKLGYHLHIHGMKGYNGVAILSRDPIKNAAIHHRVGRTDCRHISGDVNGVSIHCLYIPAGGDIPDRVANDKFGHKLDLIDEVAGWFPNTYKKTKPVLVCGDFNVAPHEHDVWSHKQLLDVVSHTPIEVEKLKAFQKSMDWVDSSREFVGADEKLYTWWSYRNQDWKKSNRGRRLDHIWVTPALKSSLHKHDVMVDARDWAQPSDHVPVVLDLK